jgi:PhnB protein
MAHLDAYIFFDGQCAEAMRFYEKALGGKLEMMMTYGEAPVGDEAPPGGTDRILHARLNVDGRSLMASDIPEGRKHEGMHGYSLSLNYLTVAEGQRAFDALAAGGTVSMPFGETFWAEGFGMLIDRFGTPWLINVDKRKP